MDSLAGGSVLMWDEIMAQPYEKVFVKLLLNKTKNEYDDRLRAIKEEGRPKK